MILLGQTYAFAYVLIILLVLLGLLAICIPRPRKRFKIPERKKIKHNRPRLNRPPV